MKKVYFFGTGFCAKTFAKKVELSLKTLGNYQIIGFLDNDIRKTGTLFMGYEVFPIHILKDNPADLILLFLMDDDKYNAVFEQLSKIVLPEKIHEYYFPLKKLLQKRYKDSRDIEIKETLEYISNNKISVFNQFITEKYTYDEVKWDKKIDLPYVEFMTVIGKKVPMYYPRDYKFIEKEGSLYIGNLIWEQTQSSPHLYVKEGHDISEGDCVIDAGACEGNFALKYVDTASHIYLFEMDPVWQEPLRYTFRSYEDRVTIITKAVSDKTTNTTCRIDDVVQNGKADFIKMDIEGAELSAICGAERIFGANDLKASICSYHRNGDEKKICTQLERYGYRTSVSEGYMLFLYADDTWEIGDLRRGIVYGDK